jgi:hypothetical protein
MIDKVLGWENKQGWVTPSRGLVTNVAPHVEARFFRRLNFHNKNLNYSL